MKTYVFNQSPSSPLLDLFRSLICKEIISIQHLDMEICDDDKVIIIVPAKQDEKIWEVVRDFIKKHKKTILFSFNETCKECQEHLGFDYQIKVIDAENEPVEEIIEQLKEQV